MAGYVGAHRMYGPGGHSGADGDHLFLSLIHISLARTSSQPGKTQTINYYNVNDAFYLVDLPGYGYAKANEAIKAQWGKMVERYLRSSKQLKTVFLLIDIRHEPSANDRQMYQWICHQGYHPVIIATKMDKLNRSQVPKALKTVREGLEAVSYTHLDVYKRQL